MGKIILACALPAIGLLAWTAPAHADDAFRLNMSGTTAAPTLSLKGDDTDAKTLAVHGWGGYRGYGWGGYRGYGWGGYRGSGWGGYRGYGWGGYGGYGWGGYRGYGWGGFYRPYYGYGGFYRPYYAGLGLGYGYPYSYGYSYYSAPLVYSYPSYSFYSAPYYCPIGSTLSTLPAVTLSIRPSRPAPEMVGPSGGSAPEGGETFPYDGGPRGPVPMPKAEDNPTGVPAIRPIPAARGNARVVSLPGPEPTTGKWAYPAYGEVPRRTGR